MERRGTGRSGMMGGDVVAISVKLRQMPGMMVFALLAVLWLAAAQPANAQAVKGEIVSVGIGGIDGKNGIYREGSWVPVQVRLRNLSGQPFTGHLAVDQDLVDVDGDKLLAIGPEFTLAPGMDERTLWTYYWPRPDYAAYDHGISRVVVLDKNRNVVPDASLSLPGGAPSATDIGPLDYAGSHHSTRFVVILGRNFGGWRGFEGMYGGTEAVRTVQLNSPSQLPDRVLGYDGVDVIYWQADAVKLSDLSPPEFTLEPILEWVKSGGHLIISVASPEQAQAFARADAKFRAVLPVTFTGENRDIKSTDVGAMSTLLLPNWGQPLRDSTLPSVSLVQSIGHLKQDGTARAVLGDAPGSGGQFADAPLVATGLCGRGAITILTFDPSDALFQTRLSDIQWINFWNQMAGWRQNDFSQNFYSQARYNALSDNDKQTDVSLNSTPIRLGNLEGQTPIQQAIDVTDVTLARVAVALLFLAIYWLLAGPVGHLILRGYKVVHWSWWIFGGTVIVATGVAGAVVFVMHVTSYEVRHQSFVLGTVTPEGQPYSDATVSSFYGIYAPVSGLVPVSEPETPGLNYLAPLCLPTEGEVRSYADPQSYALNTDRAATLTPVFRNTLKKLQARWNGPLSGTGGAPAGISGAAHYLANNNDLSHVLAGNLTNHTGYDLHDPDVLVYLPHAGRLSPDDMNYGCTYLFHAGAVWKNGEAIDLQADLKFDDLAMKSAEKGDRVMPGTVEMAVEAIGWRFAGNTSLGYGYGSYLKQNAMKPSAQMRAISTRNWRPDLLYLLGDGRNNDELSADDRRELARGIGRMTDCTKALHAAGALIVAHAEDVRSPVTLNVNNKAVEGKGSVLFAWTLPVSGEQPQNYAVPAAGSEDAGPQRAGRGTLLPDTSNPRPEGP